MHIIQINKKDLFEKYFLIVETRNHLKKRGDTEKPYE